MNFEEPTEPQPVIEVPEPEGPQAPEPVGEAAPQVAVSPLEQVILLHDKRLERIESFLKEVTARTPTENVTQGAPQMAQPMHPLVEMGLKIAEKIADRLGGGASSPISEEVAKRMMDAFWNSEIRRFQRQLGFTEHMVFTAK